MHLYHLNDVVLAIKGNAQNFLKGLSSNSLESPQNAFLNQHGRIITTFYQHKVTDDEFLIAVPPTVVENLLKHLERYAKLNRTQIQSTPLKAYMDLDTTEVLFKNEGVSSQVSDEEFTFFRLGKGLPMLGVDYHTDEFILNIDEGTYVSYTKGCFLGQEPVAKVHNRSKPTWKLTVKFQDECSPEEKTRMTSKVLDPKTGRTKGFIFVHNT